MSPPTELLLYSANPVSILPPSSTNSSAMADVMAREPPAASAQPLRCLAVRMPSPIAEDIGRLSGRNACAATRRT
jgi:hypothetical protein